MGYGARVLDKVQMADGTPVMTDGAWTVDGVQSMHWDRVEYGAQVVNVARTDGSRLPVDELMMLYVPGCRSLAIEQMRTC